MTLEEARALVNGPIWEKVRDSFLATGEFTLYPKGDPRRLDYLDDDTKQVVRTIAVSEPRKMIHQLRQVEHASRLLADLRVIETFAAGECVKVVSGPLRGLEGQVVRRGSATSLVLSVDILGRALEASVAPSDLQKLVSCP